MRNYRYILPPETRILEQIGFLRVYVKFVDTVEKSLDNTGEKHQEYSEAETGLVGCE